MEKTLIVFLVLMVIFLNACTVVQKINPFKKDFPQERIDYEYFVLDPHGNSGITTVAGALNRYASLNPKLRARVETFGERVLTISLNDPLDELKQYWIFVPKRNVTIRDINWSNFSRDFVFHGLYRDDSFFITKYPNSRTLLHQYQVDSNGVREKLSKVFKLSFPTQSFHHMILKGENSPELFLRVREQFAFESDANEKFSYSAPNMDEIPGACLLQKEYGIYRKSSGHSPSFQGFHDAVISYLQGQMEWEIKDFPTESEVMDGYAYVSKLKNEYQELNQRFMDIKNSNLENPLLEWFPLLTTKMNEITVMKNHHEILDSEEKNKNSFRHPASVLRKKQSDLDSKTFFAHYFLSKNNLRSFQAKWQDRQWLVVENFLKNRIAPYSNQLAFHVRGEMNVEPLLNEIGNTPYYLCPPVPHGSAKSIDFDGFINL